MKQSGGGKGGQNRGREEGKTEQSEGGNSQESFWSPDLLGFLMQSTGLPASPMSADRYSKMENQMHF